jgi:NADH-quinone oxidoreductase subunit G
VHPDGRLQRLRPAIARPGQVRAGWQVLCDLAQALGLDLEILSGAAASKLLFDSVPFYGGLTLEEISGHGVRWQERGAAARFPAGAETGDEAPAFAEGADDDALSAGEIAGFRSVWDAPEVEHSPSLEFLYPRRREALSR